MTLSLEAYQAVGEFQGAIDHDAEEVLSAFPDDLASIQMVFQRITEKGEGEKPIRKPETLPVLAEITGKGPEDLDRIVRSFAERDLLVLREIHENGADLTEV